MEQREIKFRAWNEDQEMYPGFWYFDLKTAIEQGVGWDYGIPKGVPYGDGWTFQEWTGLYDGTGSGIYEGDFVKIWPQYSNTVLADMKWSPSWEDDNESIIVGNVIQNPELLTNNPTE